MRTVLAVAALLLAPAALAQAPGQPAQAPGQPAPAQAPAAEALQEDPNVEANQTPESSPQGTRATQSNSTDTKTMSLTQALDTVWRSPVDLQGNPIPQPGLLSAPPPQPHDAPGGPNP
jgi:hypothetical protein